MKTVTFSVTIRLDQIHFVTEEAQVAVARFQLLNVPGVRAVYLNYNGVGEACPLDHSEKPLNEIHGCEIPGDTNGPILGKRAK